MARFGSYGVMGRHIHPIRNDEVFAVIVHLHFEIIGPSERAHTLCLPNKSVSQYSNPILNPETAKWGGRASETITYLIPKDLQLIR
jgi:hypothetical protein